METTRTFDLLERIKALYPDKTEVISGKENGKWINYSSDEYIAFCNWVS